MVDPEVDGAGGAAPGEIGGASGARNTVPGEPGVWMFVLGDMVVFGLFFAVYAYYRALDPSGFHEARLLLNQDLGALNTVLLLLSSWLVAIALADARRPDGRSAPALFASAALCGLGFVPVKSFEYAEILHAGIGITSHDLYMYYFIFTGLHLVHVVIGLGVLVFLVSLARSAAPGGDLTLMESGCVYWHMVDLLWIVLFPLLYLMP